MVAFCCGLSCIAFLYRSSAGIFAKASEIGSELVHKLEPDNVSSDKMKNPATIADKVGAALLDAGGGLQTPSRLTPMWSLLPFVRDGHLTIISG